MREWWGAPIIQMKPHSLACSSPPAVEVWLLIDQGLIPVLTHCAGTVDFCSKPSSETFCRKNHPASSLFLNKQMALKLGEEQLFSPKENNQVQHMNTFFNNCEKTSAFWESGNFAHGLDIKCSFYWEQKNIFFISYYSTTSTYYVHLVKCSFVSKILQEKWIRSKRENEMRVCLDLKTDDCYAMHSCYGLNCVYPWLPVWWH